MWLEKESASNVVVLDISDKATFVDNFIVATGMTLNHVRHLADTMQKRLRERGVFVEGAEPFIEGRDSDDWMLLDLGRFVIHIMTPDGRERYQLENLWAGSEAEGVSS
jgi:ribosome-associated protein